LNSVIITDIKLRSDIKEKLANYPLYSQEGKGMDSIILIEFDLITGIDSDPYFWLATEAEKQENDYLFFGYMCLGNWAFAEWGYFRLSELEELYSNGYLIMPWFDLNNSEEITVGEAIAPKKEIKEDAEHD